MSGLLHLFKLPEGTKSIPLEVAKEAVVPIIENKAVEPFPLAKQPKQPFKINNRKPFNSGLAGKKKQ